MKEGQTFKEILEKHKDKDIVVRLVRLYPDQRKNIDGYLGALQELRELKLKRDKMQICLHKVRKSKKWLIDESYVSVGGLRGGETYAIGLTPWEKLLGMKVKSYFNQLDTLAHCLWEFTWHGYSNKEVKKTWGELIRRADEVKKKYKKK